MGTYLYQTEPLLDFTNKEVIKKYKEGLKLVEGYLGKTYPLIINGEKRKTNELYTSVNPSNHREVIGKIYQATIEDAEDAMNAALKAFESWKKVKASTRADVLFKAAAIIRKRKYEFSALMTKEAGKPWPEADADTAEAIDFLEYYG
ncbi:MAG: aldehyde dehydrogenase family protein, partial [Candidatus Izimaplasma sp.]|nr:aldehyde dehydrogenase family protein [Candidatus Izimaplasma bacterium]